jgi:hypothetical protein
MHFSLPSAILLKKLNFLTHMRSDLPIGIVENADENYLTLNYNSFEVLSIEPILVALISSEQSINKESKIA